MKRIEQRLDEVAALTVGKRGQRDQVQHAVRHHVQVAGRQEQRLGEGAVPDLAEDRIAVIYDDVTERVEAVQALRQSERLLRDVLDGMTQTGDPDATLDSVGDATVSGGVGTLEMDFGYDSLGSC